MICVRSALLAAGLLLAAHSVNAAQARRMTYTEADAAYRQANEQFKQQKYTEARANYLAIVGGGIESPEVYYNLGTACARLGKTGEAVVYLERARKLNPRSPDVRENLRRVSPAPNVHEPFVLWVPVHWLFHQFTLREWVAAFFLVFFTAGVLGAALLSRRVSGSLARLTAALFAIAAIGSVAVGLFAGAHLYYDHSYLETVTMKPETIARSGPGDNFARMQVLPEGVKLRRLRFDDPVWSYVKLPNGQFGYVPTQNLMRI